MAAFAAGQHEVLNNLIILNEPHLTGQVWNVRGITVRECLFLFGLQGQQFLVTLKGLNLVACLAADGL
jgi:hypothetical protein